MKVVVQRSKCASVTVNNEIIGNIDAGMVVLVGFNEFDSEEVIPKMVDKIINLRIFDDESGIMNKSLLDTDGSILSISQFTLYGDATKGRRPSYAHAMRGEQATVFYDKFNQQLREKGIIVETGKFGAEMQVTLTNDGPVTIILELE